MKYSASLKESNSTFVIGEVFNESFQRFVNRFNEPFKVKKAIKGGTGTSQYIMPYEFKTLSDKTDDCRVVEYDHNKIKGGKKNIELCKDYYQDGVLVLSTDSKDRIRKLKHNVVAVTMLAIDIDKNPDKTLFQRFYDHLKNLNLNFLMYTSKGCGFAEEFTITETDVFGSDEPKETKVNAIKYNFRVFLELDLPVEPEHWSIVYNSFISDLEKQIGFTLVDRSADNIGRHQMAPLAVDGGKFRLESNVDGNPINTASYTKEAIDITAKLEAEKELRNIKRLSSVGGVGGGVLDSSRSVLGQLLWNQVDMEMLCEKIGLEDVRNANGKITCKCHHDHKTNNATSLCIIQNPDAPPTISCKATGCQFNGKGATNAFFETFKHVIPQEWIRKYAQPKIPIMCDIQPELLPSDVVTKIGNVSEIFDNPARSIAGVAKTGSGKSHNIARYAVKQAKEGNKVVVFCSTKAEIRQMYKHIKSLSGDLNVVELHMDADSSARGDIIITHYHYLLRKGHTYDLYDIVKYCEEEQPIIIYDEIDSYFDIAFKQLYISNRYSETQGKYYLNSTCPSRRTHKFSCATCRLCTNPWFTETLGTYAWSWKSATDDHMWMHPSRKDISFIPSLNNVTYEKVLHSSAIQEMTFKRLAQKSEPTDVFDNEIVITNNQHYIDDIVNSSLYVYKIQTGPDKRDMIIKQYNELSSKYDRNNSKDADKKDYDAKKSSYINIELNKDKNLYPYHSCGVDILSYLDSKGMQKIVKSAKKNIFLTATLSDNHFNALKDLTNDVVRYEVVGTGWTPVKNLLIMTISAQIDLVDHADQITKTADNIVTNTDGIEHQLTLAMTSESKNLDSIRKNSDRYKMAIYNSNMASVDTNINKYAWNVLATYKRSPIGRGINLGNYSTIWVDYSCAKSMHCYDYTTVQDLHYARMLEHDNGLSQQVGRIMRKAMDSTSTKFIDETNKVMIIHNTILQVPGEKSLVDYKEVISNRLSINYSEMCKENIFVKDITRYYDEADAVRITSIIQEHFIKTGEVIDVEPNVPSECFKTTYSKSGINIKRLYTEEEFNEIKQNVKFIEKLEFFIKEYSTLNKVLRRRSANWVRIKDIIPKKLMQQYMDFFEGE